MGDTSAAGGPPEGTVAFLFTDLEGSTRLLEAHPVAYRDAVRRHHDLLRAAVEGHGGAVFETAGDAVYAVFARPTAAVAAALAGQRALHGEPWGATGPLRARMGVHLGEAERQGARYFGAPLYRCARLTATAHGGQVVLSAAAVALVREALPEGAGLRDLGEHRLKDLAGPERVFQLAHPDLPGEFPALRTLDALPNNLPAQLTSFVGRERELADVAALLGAHRLVTLTGPGGVGKTRLALQAAADALEAYPDGVWLAGLAALADPALVPQAVAQAVGVREEPGRPLVATLTDALRPKRLLVVLDNCEHLVEACARLTDALLRACPQLTVLATSREPLGIAGETVWRVPSLPVPEDVAAPHPSAVGLARSAAVRLFADRAAAVRPGFAVTEENAAAVAQLCARLDGIPLALELAAARVRVLPPAQLLARLDDRFRLLTGGSRTALERHQTLRATVDWSYDLLSEPERTLFARLAVFAGGFSLEAAERVGADAGIAREDVLDLLTRLVDQSLVVAEAQPDGTARYRLLETLREYGREKLAASGEADAVHARHARAYLALAERAEPELRGAAQAAWLDRLEAEQQNLRAALRWFLERGEAEPGLRLGGALSHFWHVRGDRREASEWLAALLALPAAARRTAVRAKALASAGLQAGAQFDLAPAQALYEEALAISRELGDRPGIAAALFGVGFVAQRRGDLATARRALRGSRATFEELGDGWGACGALAMLGHVAAAEGDDRAARDLHTEALALARRAGDHWRVVNELDNLARVAYRQGDVTAARAALEEALGLARALNYRLGITRLLGHLGWLAVDRGDHTAARGLYQDALAQRIRLGARQGVADLLEGLAAAAAAQAQPERALRLAGAAAALSEAAGRPLALGARPSLDRWLAPARATLSPEAQATAWAAGHAMPFEQAVAYALEDAPAAA